MLRPVQPRSAAALGRPSGTGVQIRAVSDLRVGDVVEIRTWDTVHCRGEVDAVCPRLGVLWVLDGRLRDRMMVEASGHTVWRLPL